MSNSYDWLESEVLIDDVGTEIPFGYVEEMVKLIMSGQMTGKHLDPRVLARIKQLYGKKTVEYRTFDTSNRLETPKPKSHVVRNIAQKKIYQVRGEKKWKWGGYTDLGRIVGMTPSAVKQRRHRGEFDPEDLLSLINFVLKFRPDLLNMEGRV